MHRRGLTDVRRAEALATAAVRSLAENSTRAEGARNETLPSMKASFPGRSDRECTCCTRAWGAGSPQ